MKVPATSSWTPSARAAREGSNWIMSLANGTAKGVGGAWTRTDGMAFCASDSLGAHLHALKPSAVSGVRGTPWPCALPQEPMRCRHAAVLDVFAAPCKSSRGPLLGSTPAGVRMPTWLTLGSWLLSSGTEAEPRGTERGSEPTISKGTGYTPHCRWAGSSSAPPLRPLKPKGSRAIPRTAVLALVQPSVRATSPRTKDRTELEGPTGLGQRRVEHVRWGPGGGGGGGGVYKLRVIWLAGCRRRLRCSGYQLPPAEHPYHRVTLPSPAEPPGPFYCGFSLCARVKTLQNEETAWPSRHACLRAGRVMQPTSWVTNHTP